MAGHKRRAAFRPMLPGLVFILGLPVGLASCKSALIGEWDGICELDDGELYFKMDLTREWRGRSEGEGSFTYSDERFQGEVFGRRVGEDVDLELEAVYGGYLLVLDVLGDMDGDEIDGTCAFDELPGSVYMKK